MRKRGFHFSRPMQRLGCIAVLLLPLGAIVYQRLAFQWKYRNYYTLLDAVDRKDARAVEHELQRGTDPNDMPPCETEEDIAPLCQAASGGDQASVKVLLAHGADVNICDGWNYNPLTAAAIEDDVPMMQLLLARGAIMQDGEAYSCTLWRAAVEGKTKAVALLLSKGVNPDPAIEGVGKLTDALRQMHQTQTLDMLKKAIAKRDNSRRN